jgi:hypothetical protein
MRSRISIPLALVALVVVSISYAAVRHYQSGSKNEGSSNSKNELRVTVEGELKAMEDSGSKSDSASQLVLRVTRSVTDEGRELLELRAQTLDLVDGTKAEDLFKKHGEGEKLIIRGGL